MKNNPHVFLSLFLLFSESTNLFSQNTLRTSLLDKNVSKIVDKKATKETVSLYRNLKKAFEQRHHVWPPG